MAWWMREKPLGLVAASGRALHFLVSLGELCLCLVSQCVSICVKLFMLPQHLFASPVVMFTKSKFKYMSCRGKVINMHVEMMWSLDVPVRGGGRAGGEGLGQMHTPVSALGSRGKPLSWKEESVLATKSVSGLCPPHAVPMAKGPGGASQGEQCKGSPSSASPPLAWAQVKAPAVPWEGEMGERAQRGAGWEGDRQQ